MSEVKCPTCGAVHNSSAIFRVWHPAYTAVKMQGGRLIVKRVWRCDDGRRITTTDTRDLSDYFECFI